MVQVSVIVATRNRPTQLRRCLDSLARQGYPRDTYEVIVVDDGSECPLDDVIAPFRDRLQVLLCREQRSGGPGLARNTGARHARGRWLAFTDDDCEPAEDWLAALTRSLGSCDGCGVGGTVMNSLTTSLYSSASQLLVTYLYDYFNRDLVDGVLFASNNLAFPADRFREIGGFDTTYPLTVAEDRVVCVRWRALGGRIVFAADAVVRHAHPLTLKTFWRQHFAYGRGAYAYRWVRMQRGAGPVRVEPLAFYRGLVTCPFARRLPRAWQLSSLLVLAQVANVCGFLIESLCLHRGRRQPRV